MSVGSWLLILPDVAFIEENHIPVLMIGLPIIIFIGMLWVRWWAFRIPELDYGR